MEPHVRLVSQWGAQGWFESRTARGSSAKRGMLELVVTAGRFRGLDKSRFLRPQPLATDRVPEVTFPIPWGKER